MINSNTQPLNLTADNSKLLLPTSRRTAFAKSTLLMFGAATLALGGCQQAAPKAENAVTPDTRGAIAPATVSTPVADDGEEAKKLDGYVEAHNSIVGTFGFLEKAEAYRNAHISSASVSGRFNINSGWINQGLTKLKAANGIAAPTSDLDDAAGALVVSMTKVQTHLASLEIYYSSKKYLDDKLARGKAEDAQMLAEFDAAQKDYRRFSALLDVALDKRDEALLAELKNSNPLKYSTKLALFHAKKLVNLFNKPEDAGKPDLIAKADTEVALIEKATADAHAEASKAGKPDPTALNSLTSMIGSYRSLKQGHEGNDMEAMVRDYNQAVDLSNTFGNME